MKKQTIAIIGFGRFGQLLTSILETKTNHDLIIITTQKRKPWSNRVRITTDIKAVKLAHTIFPCVPIRHFEKTMKEISAHLTKDATVIDVCSVKTFPTQIMSTQLPTTCNIIASHPMFGKASVEKNPRLTGLKCVLWNVRCNQEIFHAWEDMLQELGFDVIKLSPEQHDLHAAHSQAFTQLVGLLMEALHLESTPINTVWFDSLLKIKAVVQSQNSELIEDMFTFNPESRQLLSTIQSKLNTLLAELENGVQK